MDLRFRSGTLFLAAIAVFSGCERKLDIDAPEPRSTADTDTLPSLPTSTLDIPLTYDLSQVVKALDGAVPKRFGNIEDRHDVKGQPRMKVAFEATRDPFKVSLTGQTAHLTAIIHYAGKGWYKAPV